MCLGPKVNHLGAFFECEPLAARALYRVEQARRPHDGRHASAPDYRPPLGTTRPVSRRSH